MKLIIEIPEQTYKDYKEGINSLRIETEIANAVFDGTPITELSGNIFANILLSEINKKGLAFEEVLLLIDNAPTIGKENDNGNE